MSTVKRAIIVAAGMGNRLRPVTNFTPKPLVSVNGVRMIDTIIKGLHENGINSIYIVTGYLAEQFEVLLKEYDGITLIKNPYYESCNNISSLYMVRDYLEDSIILDGDLIIKNSGVLEKNFDKSGYNAIWTDSRSEEWILETENRKIVSCSRDGGDKGWQLFSISRWNSADGKKLKKFIEFEFQDKMNRQIYWDDVPMFCYFDEFDLMIRPMNQDDVIEVDNYEELVKIDPSYITHGGNI